jgi:hypothetical protein
MEGGPAVTEPARLRVGLFVSGREPAAWQHDVLARLRTLQAVEVIVWAGPPSPRPGLAWARLARRAPALRPRPLSEPPAAAGGEAGCDIVLDLTGGVGAEVARGVPIWTICDGASRPLAGEFPGLADIGSGRGAVLTVRIRQEPPVRRAWFACGPWYAATFQRLYAEAVDLIAAAVRDRRDGVPGWSLPPADPRAAAGPASVAARLVEGACRAAVRRLASMLRAESWMIGLIDRPIAEVATDPRSPAVRWLGRRGWSGYQADPFGVPGTTDRIYCESVQAADGVGVIEELQLRAAEIESVARVALPVAGHLSYPFLFEHGGRLHCVPESVESRETRLLRWNETRGWSTLAVLASGVAVADPTLFRWQGRFWLAYTDADRSPFDNLNLLFAEQLAGPWQPHPGNPVKVDVGSSRPGGTPFLHEGALYRPAQDCSATYGGAIAINRVDLCTPEAFREQTVRVLAPGARDANPAGWHTLSAWGERTLIDGKRDVVNPLVLRRKLRLRMRALRGRVEGALSR